ncbi:MAG: LPXTG cell wall anchor domain-containing protein [Anaerolineales bacterium]|jgi:LPXTG-motif cell wall-anchored protein
MSNTQWIVLIGGFFITVLVPALILVRRRRKV